MCYLAERFCCPAKMSEANTAHSPTKRSPEPQNTESHLEQSPAKRYKHAAAEKEGA